MIIWNPADERTAQGVEVGKIAEVVEKMQIFDRGA